jgi:ribonuclease PH
MSESAPNSGSRPDGRHADELRPIRFQNDIAPNALGSTLIEWQNTRVICSAMIDESVPRWMKEQGVQGGWLSAEYSMLPYSTHDRICRYFYIGKIDGRSQELHRLFVRSLSEAVDMK